MKLQILLRIITISLIKTSTIKFDYQVFCDDYTDQFLIGETSIVADNVHNEAIKIYEGSMSVEFYPSIIVTCTNLYSDLVFTGTFNFYYFSISTDKHTEWNITGENCVENVIQGGFNKLEHLYPIGMNNSDGKFNHKSCTYTYNFRLCPKKTMYFTETTTEVKIDGFLDVEKGQYYEFLEVYATFPNTLIGTFLFDMQDGLGYVSTEPFKIEKSEFDIKYTIVQRHIIDTFSFDVTSKDMENASNPDIHFDTCYVNFVVCGINCVECRTDNFFCTKCKNGYAFIEGNEYDCTLIQDPYPYYYYITNENKYYQCYETCELCSKLGDNTNHKCSQCLASYPYYYIDNENLKSCLYGCDAPLHYKENSNECVDNCDYYLYRNTCVSSCPPEAQYKDGNLCVSTCDYILDDHCVVSCLSEGKYSYTNNDGSHLCLDNCPIDKNIIFTNDECISQCESPYYLDGNLCIPSCPSNKVYIENTNICIDSCPSSLYLQDNMKCVLSCDSNSPLIDKDNMICYSMCPNGSYKYQNECVSSCPIDMIPNQYNECIIDLHLDYINESYSHIHLSLNQTVSYVDKYILEYLNVNQTILGEDFILQVYTTNTTPTPNNSISFINMTQCEIVLRRFYQIKDEEPIIVLKYDYNNKLEYEIYDKDKNRLNTDICQGIDINISYPSSIILSELVNSNNTYFNDLCISYTKEGPNVLNERRKEYINISLCEDNCQYTGINYITNQINCKCSVKSDFDLYSNTRTHINEFKTNNNFPSSLLILKCYNVLTDINNVLFNIGFWIFLFILSMHCGFIVIVFLRDKITLYSSLKLSEKASPQIKDTQKAYCNEDNTTENHKGLYSHEKAMSSTKLKMKETEDDEETKEDNQSDIKVNIFFKYFTQSDESKETPIIHNYPFAIALIKDDRNFCRMFIEIYKSKHFLFNTTQKDKIISIGINLSLFFISISLCFILNIILYTDQRIINAYKFKEQNEFYISLTKALFSSILSEILIKLVKTFHQYNRLFYTVLLSITDNKLENKTQYQIIKRIKREIILFIITLLIVHLLLWYYATIFCIIYNGIQFNWCSGGALSIYFLLVIDIFYCLLLTVCRYIGLKCKSKAFYNIELFFSKLY